MRMNTEPQCPTTDSITVAIDGCAAVASSPRGITPYDSRVTRAKIASTLRKPTTVALPTSSRFFAKREYTVAPSMPRKTNVVTIIVALTCSNKVDSDASSPPHQL